MLAIEITTVIDDILKYFVVVYFHLQIARTGHEPS